MKNCPQIRVTRFEFVKKRTLRRGGGWGGYSMPHSQKSLSLYSMSSLLLLQFGVLQSARELPNRCHLYLPLTHKCLLCMSCTQLPKHHGRDENMGIFFLVRPWTYIYVSAWLQMSCAIVNNATSGGGKVLSVARLEMAKYRTKGSKWSHLEDNYRASGNTEIGRPMTVLSTVRARARRWLILPVAYACLKD